MFDSFCKVFASIVCFHVLLVNVLSSKTFVSGIVLDRTLDDDEDVVCNGSEIDLTVAMMNTNNIKHIILAGKTMWMMFLEVECFV